MDPTLPLRCQSLKHTLLLPGIQFLLVCSFCGLNLIWGWQCQSLSNYRQRRERQETQCAVCTLSVHLFVCLSTKKERFLQGSFPPSDSEQPLQPLQLCLVGKTPTQQLSQEQRTSQRNIPGTASRTAVLQCHRFSACSWHLTWDGHRELALPVVTGPPLSSFPSLLQLLTATSAPRANLHKPRMQKQCVPLVFLPRTLSVQAAPGIRANADQYTSMKRPISLAAELWRQPLSLQAGWVPWWAAFNLIFCNLLHNWQTTDENSGRLC